MKSRFRYSLRAILVVTALLALAIGYWSQMRRTENQVQRLLGEASFTRVARVNGLLGEISDDDLKKVADLRAIESVSNNHAWMGSQIGTLMFDKPNRNPIESPISDVGLKHLSGCKSLTSIGLFGDSMTDKGVTELTRLPQLEYLAIGSTRVTDKSVPSLLKMTSLETLVVRATMISSDGAEQLKRGLPNCKVYD